MTRRGAEEERHADKERCSCATNESNRCTREVRAVTQGHSALLVLVVLCSRETEACNRGVGKTNGKEGEQGREAAGMMHTKVTVCTY